MIIVKGSVSGKEYTSRFSKGILSRSLIRAEMSPDQAYEIASRIEEDLIKKNITEITTGEIAEIVVNLLENEDPSVAERYLNWRKVRQAKDPLIILIGGASGVGTSSMAFEISNRLGIKTMISTDMIREVMRKIVSEDLSPVIHESSFSAYKSMRVAPPPEFDYVLAGFKDQVGTVTVGVEAVIERALTEGISIVIEGVHLVPGFINPKLMEKDNVVMFTLTLSDENMHKNRFYSRSRDIWNNRPVERYLENFDAIRKTNNYLCDQAMKEGVPVIDNIDVVTTVDFIIETLTKTYGGMKHVRED
ncbi:MAG: 2-phosphoglycerate kinase [Methanobrevibacter sp.]|nr:2-phosphoglycerate kinase [Methanobrevibacter sp.]